MRNIRKRFGSTQALDGVDLTLFPGEIHALVGENGAGKSTLMKVLSGAVRADVGTMRLDDQTYLPANPHDAARRGVGMIYQELTLAPHLTVEENVLLGQEPRSWGILNRTTGRERVREALAELDHRDIPLDQCVADLGPAEQQLVEIARALLKDVRVLVLDEPTSSLTPRDAERLFALMRRLKKRDVSIVYISHYLEEIKQIADRFTVLRDGRSVTSGEVQDTPVNAIIEAMVGRPLDELFPHVAHEPGEVILSVQDLGLQRRNLVHSEISFDLRRGEILGIAGMVGAGRTDLLRALFALDPVRRGKVIVQHVEAPSRSVRRRIRQGFGLVSENRKEEGLALSQSIEDNLTYSQLGMYARAGWLNLGARRRHVLEWLERLKVRCFSATQPVGQLSGGNQQKIALGRLLHQHADILLLDEPTRGVDIGSKAEIYRLIGELAAQGKAILFVSSYLPELLAVCDRLAVMNRGRLGPARPTRDWTPETVIAEATR